MTTVRQTAAVMGAPNNSSKTQMIFVPTLKNMTLTLLPKSRSVQQAKSADCFIEIGPG